MPDIDKPQSKKRKVKDPESFRQKALREKSGQAEKRKLTSSFKVYLSKLFSPIANLFRKIAKQKAFRPFVKPVKLIFKIIFPKYFRSSLKELKLVTWPTLKQSRQLTFAVLIFAIIFGASIALLDLGLDKIFRNILLK
ncbi:MAG TPA: preprotein translocase subunit SecE [Patescibacteria group bacterium]|nr:preprotein translocase subunit SecE [Patescibacteria group bacterium]